MKLNNVMMCIFALILGLLTIHMFSNVCGCKSIVEGQCSANGREQERTGLDYSNFCDRFNPNSSHACLKAPQCNWNAVGRMAVAAGGAADTTTTPVTPDTTTTPVGLCTVPTRGAKMATTETDFSIPSNDGVSWTQPLSKKHCFINFRQDLKENVARYLMRNYEGLSDEINSIFQITDILSRDQWINLLDEYLVIKYEDDPPYQFIKLTNLPTIGGQRQMPTPQEIQQCSGSEEQPEVYSDPTVATTQLETPAGGPPTGRQPVRGPVRSPTCSMTTAGNCTANCKTRPYKPDTGQPFIGSAWTQWIHQCGAIVDCDDWASFTSDIPEGIARERRWRDYLRQCPRE